MSYALGITDIDPLRYELLFERFLNPDRISMPDIDIDFCMRRRGEVIQYVSEKYGRDRVAQIITFGTLGAKAVLRDVGRVLGVPYGKIDRIAKLVPDMTKSLSEAAREIEALPPAELVTMLIEGRVETPGPLARTLNEFGYETSGTHAVALFQELDIERRRLLARHMADIAKADSELAENEMRLLKRTLELLGIGPADVAKPGG